MLDANKENGSFPEGYRGGTSHFKLKMTCDIGGNGILIEGKLIFKV